MQNHSDQERQSDEHRQAINTKTHAPTHTSDSAHDIRIWHTCREMRLNAGDVHFDFRTLPQRARVAHGWPGAKETPHINFAAKPRKSTTTRVINILLSKCPKAKRPSTEGKNSLRLPATSQARNRLKAASIALPLILHCRLTSIPRRPGSFSHKFVEVSGTLRPTS